MREQPSSSLYLADELHRALVTSCCHAFSIYALKVTCPKKEPRSITLSGYFIRCIFFSTGLLKSKFFMVEEVSENILGEELIHTNTISSCSPLTLLLAAHSCWLVYHLSVALLDCNRVTMEPLVDWQERDANGPQPSVPSQY